MLNTGEAREGMQVAIPAKEVLVGGDSSESPPMLKSVSQATEQKIE